MWEIHLGCELHFLWIWWLCDHVYQRTARLVLCWLRRTVQSSFVQIFFSTVLTIALCLYQGATKAVKKWLNFGWTDFFVCCKVCWGLSREALEMELLLYKVRPKYHQLLGSEETSILSAHGAGTILCWPFFDVGNLRLDHLVIDQSQYCNPMASSTYDDEDFVGKTKKLAQMCQPMYLGYQCLERYAAYVCCRWLRQLTDWW